MEAKLFFVSLWCGVYGLVLRFFEKKQFTDRPPVLMVLNGLFWGTAGLLLGLLLASYTERLEQISTHPGQMAVYSAFYFVGGFVLGLVLGWFNGREEKKRTILLKDNLEWADTGFSAILLASVVMFFVVQAFKIPSGSMRMTLVEGDHLFVNKFIYGVPVPFTDKKVLPLKSISQGDIVIFRFPSNNPENPHYGKDFIKRVVATQGQMVQIVDKAVIVDGVPLDEPYKTHVDAGIHPKVDLLDPVTFEAKWTEREFANSFGDQFRDNFGPITVPPGHVFVMGDNRDRSFDARYWGPLPMKAIKGKAWLLYWPFSRFKVVH